jgi:hypothetical protein
MLVGNSEMLTPDFSSIKLPIPTVGIALAMGWMAEGSEFEPR